MFAKLNIRKILSDESTSGIWFFKRMTRLFVTNPPQHDMRLFELCCIKFVAKVFKMVGKILKSKGFKFWFIFELIMCNLFSP